MWVLPVNESPFVRAYSHHAFVNSIINNPNTYGEKVAEIEFINKEKQTYQEEKTSDFIIKKTDDIYEFFLKQYAEENNYILYRECNNIDEIMIKINYQQQTSIWGSIGVFLTSNATDLKKFEIPMLNYINFCCEGIFINYYGEHKNNHEIPKLRYPVWLKIKKHMDEVIFLYSYNGCDWKEEMIVKVEEELQKEVKIGVKVTLGNNQYDHWFFTNYIQLFGSTKDYIPIDYYVFARRDFKYYNLHPFLTSRTESIRMIEDYGLSLLDFMKITLSNNRYIEMILDEYYVPNRLAYVDKFHYNHQNLIYGFDDDTKIFYLQGYDERNYIKNSTISYKDLCIAYSNSDINTTMEIIEYKPDMNSYEMNIKKMSQFLKDYIDGKNSSEDVSHIVVSIDRIYGIKLYDEFLKDKHSIGMLMTDVRIAYILFEHKKCMKERLNYLVANDVVTKDEISDIQIKINEIYRLSNEILNIVIRYRHRQTDISVQNVMDNMREVKELELHCYKELHDLLVTKIR